VVGVVGRGRGHMGNIPSEQFRRSCPVGGLIGGRTLWPDHQRKGGKKGVGEEGGIDSLSCCEIGRQLSDRAIDTVVFRGTPCRERIGPGLGAVYDRLR